MRRGWRTALVLAALAALVMAAYAPLRGAGFVSDDDLYASRNPTVRAGLTWEGARWALTTGHAANWHPLTWLSLMLDASLFGDGPRGFHLMNVAYHAAGAWLTFLVLSGMTGAFWRPALVAAVFAAHPLHVESVAWVSERKDVLSGVFFWLAVAAYLRHARRPDRRSPVPALALFALGLMAKPMLVTLPFLLLLLDFWPLGRLRAGTARLRALTLGKWPWFLLAAASSAVTLIVQSRGEAVQSLENLPLGWRVANALLSYVRYLRLALWPHPLSPVHPFPPEAPPVAGAAAAALLLLLVSVLAVRGRRGRPWLAVGWIWYLGMLVPVIGLVQVGGQTMADRYTYLPLNGFFLALVWTVAGLLRERAALRAAAGVLGASSLVVLAAASRIQAAAWESGVTLYRRALAASADHELWLAHYGLGIALQDAGEGALAAQHYRDSIRLRPTFPGSRSNLGVVLTDAGRLGEALASFDAAIRLAPDDPRAYYGRGRVLARLGRKDEAVDMYRTALRLKPDLDEALIDLGEALAGRGMTTEALAVLEEAVRRLPQNSRAWYFLGRTLAREGREAEAVSVYREALRLRPGSAEIHAGLGAALAALGREEEALPHLREAARLQSGLAPR